MTGAALLWLLGQQAVAGPAAAGVSGCLPDQAGFLSMRLRGSIEAEVRWQEPELDCTGMARPDGRGLRLRFAGPVAGRGTLAIVFAAPELGMGVSARAVPVNVTLLDDAGERIYGTQGEERCAFDQVEQQAIHDAALPPRSYRVLARGFCTAPARAMDGEGAVLLTRFDFAGVVSFGDDPAPAGNAATPAP
ncbi:MAG: hypothetical protein ACREVI_00180 [Steroidobacteraceae bacterium]